MNVKNDSQCSLKLRFGYGSSDFACSMLWSVITTYLLYFYTDVVGLAAATVSLVFLFARAIDSVVDVMVGLAIDKTRTRWGKSRPFILFGAIPLGLFSALSFYVPDMGEVGLVVYAFATYLGLSIFYSVVNIPMASILPSLTSSSRERTVLATWRTVFSFAGSTVAAVLMMPMVKTLGGESERNGFMWSMLIFSTLASIVLLYSFTTLKEKNCESQETHTLKKVIASLRHNRPWQIFFTNVFFMWGSYFLYQGALVYYFTYNVGRADLVPIFAGISTFVPLLGTLLAPPLNNFLLKKTVFTIASIINLAGLIVLIFSEMNITLLYVGCIVAALGQGIRLSIYYSMQADPVDYGQWKTGVNAAGTLSSVITFGGKLTMAGAGALSAWLLSWGGYVPGKTQTPDALFAIEMSFLVLPAALVAISTVLMQFYKLDSEYPRMRAELDARERAPIQPAVSP